MRLRYCGVKAASKFVLLLLLSSCYSHIGNVYSLRQENAVQDMARLYEGAIVPKKPISIDMAVQLALAQNWEMQFQDRQERVQHDLTRAEKLAMLPALTLEGEYSNRDSQPVTFGSAPAQERYTRRWSAELAWKSLDFGLSYFRARQESNRLLLLKQQQLRSRQDLILSVVENYWLASAYQKAYKSGKSLIEKLVAYRETITKQTQDRLIPEVAGLQLEDQLMQLKEQLVAYESLYEQSMVRLASLMGIPLHQDFELAQVVLPESKELDVDVFALEEQAINLRPELASQDIEEKISIEEAKMNIVRMVPGVKLFAGHDTDENKFLLNNQWATIGAQATWNLLSIPSEFKKFQSSKHQREFIREQRLATTVGVLTQVNLSYLQAKEAAKRYENARIIYGLKTRLFEAAQKEVARGTRFEVEAATMEVEALISWIEAMVAFANFETGMERIAHSVGKPLLFSDFADSDDLMAEYVVKRQIEGAGG